SRELWRRNVLARVLSTGDPAITEDEGIPTIRLRSPRYALNFAVAKIIHYARGVSIIQTFNYHACLPSLIAAWILPKPVFCMFLGIMQEVWPETHGLVLGRARIVWERFLLTRRYARTIFLSEANLEKAVRLGVERRRALVNMPGIPSDIRGAAPGKNNTVLF